MHLLLTAIGSYGDVHPMIGLGAAMRERGHEVTLITNPYFAEEIETAGLEWAAISSVEEYQQVTSHPDIWHSRRGMSLVFRWSAERLLRPLYERIVQFYRPGETVIAAHPLDIASRIARESLAAPVVSVVFAPMTLWSDDQPPRMSGAPIGPGKPRWWNRGWLWLGEQVVMRRFVRPHVAAVRRGLGLRSVGRIFPDWWFSSGHTLALFPDWFVGSERPPADWPAGTELAGFPLWDGDAPQQPAALNHELETWLDLHRENRPLVFTPGSANRSATHFFDQAIDACGRLGRPALFLTKYTEQLPSHRPPWVRHATFEPLSRVLPRAAAFVHHGGIGSCSQGLAAGIPQLIHPLSYDQPDNALRLEQLGVGATLPPSAFTGSSAAAALSRLLDSRTTADRCRQLATRCNGSAARERACEYFERLAN